MAGKAGITWMKLKTFVVALVLILALFLFAQRHSSTPAGAAAHAVVDLTHVAGPNSPTYEAAAKSPFSATTVSTIAKGGYFAREIALPEHFSTHIDAPAHFAAGGWTVDQIPADRLFAPLVVLDVTAQAREHPDYQLAAGDIAAWEARNGTIPEGAVVMMRSGWSERWDQPARYRNAGRDGVLHFPGYSLDAARFLVEGRHAIALGIDTLSVDYGPSKDFPVHHFTAARSVYHLENVADLWRVPESGAQVVVGPAKLAGGSGGPVRILALLP